MDKELKERAGTQSFDASETGHIYIAIDLKSFYASVECVERGLDPLTTNLVVADASRTEKTICLAVSPSLKAYGIPGRARLFEVVQKVKEVNRGRLGRAPGREFTGASYFSQELASNPSLELSYITAIPRMAYYIEYSTRIYDIYLKYVAKEDIHVYSIDEVFMDVTQYLHVYKMTARELAMVIIKDVLRTTGITATAGVGTNLYLCKVAMDIVAKHVEPNEDGVRIAALNEKSYRQLLWNHRPLTDFWRLGRGYEKKLEENGLFTMGDIARCSLGGPADFYNEDLLYRLFGINAELLIDHAWGWEPCTIEDIRGYRPQTNSLSFGQVLQQPYPMDKAKLIVKEMTDMMALDLVEKGLVTDQLTLTLGHDIENLTDPSISSGYRGEVTEDRYGRRVPKHAHGTANLGRYTASSELMTEKMLELFDRITDPALLVRRVTVVANHVVSRDSAMQAPVFEQLSLFAPEEETQKKQISEERMERELQMQKAVVELKKKFGKNAVLKGMNLEEGASARNRNAQIGGHKA